MSLRRSIQRFVLWKSRVLHRSLHFYRQLDCFKFWKNQCTAIKQYWTIYGGKGAFFKSPYVHIAAALAALCSSFWYFGWWTSDIKAADIAISALPNLLGFTVGALAIVLAFSSAEIFKSLAEEGSPESFFIKLTTNLVHFIFVQVLAILVGVLAKLSGSKALDFVSLFAFFYAVLVTLATGVQLFQTAIIYNAHASLPVPKRRSKQKRRPRT